VNLRAAPINFRCVLTKFDGLSSPDIVNNLRDRFTHPSLVFIE
jgi:hypothetical protein